jgi:hypothetical protein
MGIYMHVLLSNLFVYMVDLWLGVDTMQMGCIDMGVGPTDACMLPMTP